MDSRLITAIEVVVGVPAVLIAYIWVTERLVTLLPDRWQPRVRPWLWLAPALGFLGFFLIYPTVRTIIRSLQSKNPLQAEVRRAGQLPLVLHQQRRPRRPAATTCCGWSC